MKKERRNFLKETVIATVGSLALGQLPLYSLNNTLEETPAPNQGEFKISLAEWSLHRAIFDGKINHLDFAEIARNKYGLDAIEYVNRFFKDKAQNIDYLQEMKNRCDDNGVKSLLIMVGQEGNLGDSDEKKRNKAIEKHYKWVDAAKFLGCHSIRVNASGKGSEEEVAKAMIESLGKLSEYAAKAGINIIVENHGGYSSKGKWLANIIKTLDLVNCGTLPDFGNFTIDKEKQLYYDAYKGVKYLVPYAKGISAKSYDFDQEGNETKIDYYKMMKIIRKSTYRGYIGIEYEGEQLSEHEGILKTKALLEKVFKNT